MCTYNSVNNHGIFSRRHARCVVHETIKRYLLRVPLFLSNNTKNENLFLKRNFLFIDIKGNPFTFDIKDKKKLTVQYVGQLRRLSFPLAWRIGFLLIHQAVQAAIISFVGNRSQNWLFKCSYAGIQTKNFKKNHNSGEKKYWIAEK
jgi:hypothetical protein